MCLLISRLSGSASGKHVESLAERNFLRTVQIQNNFDCTAITTFDFRCNIFCSHLAAL